MAWARSTALPRFLLCLALGLAALGGLVAPARAATAVTFVADGDMGVNGNAAANVKQMASVAPAFALLAGDLAYSGGSTSVWDQFMQEIQPINDLGQTKPAIGNHDYEGCLCYYLDRFQVPRYYSFNYSTIHVISLDGGSWPGNPLPAGENTWLQRDLAYNANDGIHPWTVVVFHFPLFSTGEHGSWLGGRSMWGSLFDRYGVDLVINGHDHDYERSWPVWSNGTVQQTSYQYPSAPVYIVTGGGGESLYTVTGNAAWSAYHASTYESLRITIDGDAATVQATRPDGSQLDSFTFQRRPAPLAVAITSPHAGATVAQANITASGTAGGPSLAGVQVRTDGGPWQTATGTTSWTVPLTLREGTNLIEAMAFDAGGNASPTASVSVTYRRPNTAPVASFTITPAAAVALTNFTVDASNSSDAEDSSSALQVRWDWTNDGVWDTDWTTAKVAWHTFASPGNFTVALEVEDTGGLTSTAQRKVIVEAPPALGVSISRRTPDPTQPLDVELDATIEGGRAPFTYAWDLGDGTRATGPSVAHRYAGPGTYLVTLAATDALGTRTGTNTSVVLAVPPPSVAIVANATQGVVPLGLAFGAQVVGGLGPYTYAWEFGDGTTGSHDQEIHAYPTPGLYTVRLSVQDSLGHATNATMDIRALAPLAVAAVADAGELRAEFQATVQGGAPPYAYTWDFGDGTQSREAAPAHAYAKPGRYTVTVQVQDGSGQSTVRSLVVQVAGTPATSQGFASPPPALVSLLIVAGLAPLVVVGWWIWWRRP